MKKLLALLTFAALCAAVLCLPALAAEPEQPAESQSLADSRPYAASVWGKVSDYQDSSFTLQNPYPAQMELIVHLAASTPVVDAVSSLPLSQTDIHNGDTVYAWVSPAMTMSLPPQSSAVVVVTNVPADAAAPQYYEISAASAITGTGSNRSVTLTAAGGATVTVTGAASIVPFETKNRVMLEDLLPGTSILVWTDNNAVSKVVVFPYAYRGYLQMRSTGLSVNGEALAKSARVVDGVPYLPIRAVAEAAGYTVTWDANRGAVVSDGTQTVYSIRPDSRTLYTADGSASELEAPCLISNGTTYLLATELASLLNLYIAG